MRGLIRKVLGLGMLGILLAMPVVMAQRQGGGGKKGHSGGGKRGKAGKRAPAKGRGGN